MMKAVQCSFAVALGCGGVSGQTAPRVPYTKVSPTGSLLERGYFTGEDRAGCWELFHPNERLRERGCYEDGKKVGTWSRFDEQGTLI